MRTSESIDKVCAALIKARETMHSVGMSGFNNYDKYQYAKLLDYTKAVEQSLRDNDLAIVTGGVEAVQLPDRKNQKGNDEYTVRLKLCMRLVHSSGQWIEVDAYGDGQDRGDKGIYKAHTGARKYGIASLFGLATGDDPETADNIRPENPPPAQRKTPPKEMKGPKQQLVELVGKWSGLNPEDHLNATQSFIKHRGYPDKITNEQANALCEFVHQHMAAGDDFIKTIGDKQ